MKFQKSWSVGGQRAGLVPTPSNLLQEALEHLRLAAALVSTQAVSDDRLVPLADSLTANAQTLRLFAEEENKE